MTTVKRNKKLVTQVKLRDRDICQCCYASGLDVSTEVHHIQPLVMGGEDDANNMVVLCKTCHKHAPDNPDDFLQYQKERGQVGSLVLAKALLQSRGEEIKNPVGIFNEIMLERFFTNWMDHNDALTIDD